MISVIIPSYKNPHYLEIAITSYLKTKSLESEMIVVIDGYENVSSHLIEEYKNKINFIVFDENSGMSHALNIGVQNAKYEKILIINDDNVFCNKWDVNTIKHFTDDKKVITPNQIEPEGQSIFNFIIKNFGTNYDNFNFKNFLDFEDTIKRDEETNDGGIFPFVINKKYYMSVGGFDIAYNSPFVVDWDFFLKLELIGMKFVRIHDVNFYHFGSKATKKNSDMNTSKQFYEGEKIAREQFKDKWGFLPVRNIDNSHSPKNQTFRGIKF